MFGSDYIMEKVVHRAVIALIGLKTKNDNKREGEWIRGGLEDSRR